MYFYVVHVLHRYRDDLWCLFIQLVCIPVDTNFVPNHFQLACHLFLYVSDYFTNYSSQFMFIKLWLIAVFCSIFRNNFQEYKEFFYDYFHNKCPPPPKHYIFLHWFIIFLGHNNFLLIIISLYPSKYKLLQLNAL